MRGLFIACISCAVTAIVPAATTADAKPTRVSITNLATVTEDDKATAIDEAKSKAEAGLICVGKLEDVVTKLSGCTKIGDRYTCTAIANATCVIGA